MIERGPEGRKLGKQMGVGAGSPRRGRLEYHHVEEHAKGVRTVLENGVLVHAECHPKGPAAVESAANFKGNGQAPGEESEPQPN